MAAEDQLALVERNDSKIGLGHPKPCSTRKLFSLATGTDWLYLGLGVFGAIVSGWWPPLVSITIANMAGDLAMAMNTRDFDLMMDQARSSGGIVAMFATAWVVSGTIQAFGFNGFQERVVRKARRLYLKSMLDQDLSWYDGETIASLPAEMNADLAQISDGFGNKFSSMIAAISCIVVGYGLAFWLGWQVALVMSASVPLVASAQALSAKVIAAVHTECQGQYAVATEVVEESLYSIKTVMSLGYERNAIDRFTQVMEIVRKIGVRKGFRRGLILGCNWLAQISSYSLCFWYGARCIRDGVINTSTGRVYEGKQIAGVFLTIFTVCQMIGNLDPGITCIRKARMSAARMFELAEKDLVINRAGKDERKVLKCVETIVFDNVFFSYPSRPDQLVLNGVTLEIRKGQKVAFVGSSGCGKSTLLGLLERFYDPTLGQVLLNGDDLKAFSMSTVRKAMGFVAQDPVIFAGTIRQNVMRGSPDATDDEIEQALKTAQCYFIKTLPDGLETSGGQFSHGQKQRIAIARTLVKKPSVLLLDEATSALDSTSERMLLEALDDLARESAGDLTMINITHRLSTSRTADCIFMFVRGVVTERGSHRDLMLKHGDYYELSQSQAAALIAPDNSDIEEEDEEENQEEPLPYCSSRIIRLASGQKSRSSTSGSPCKSASAARDDVPKNYKAPMSRLMSFNKPEWWCIPLSCLGALATGGSFPFIGMLIVKANASFYIPDRSDMYDESMKVVYSYLIITGIMFLGTILQFGTCGILAEGMIKRMRISIFTQILRQEVGFHDDPHHSAAQLGSHIQLWPHRISSLSDSICVNFSTLGAFLVGIAMSFYYCWPVCLLMSASFPFVFLSTGMHVMFADIAGIGAGVPENAQTLMSEMLQNPKTIQALCMAPEVVNDFVKMADPHKGQSLLKRRMKAFSTALSFGVTNSIMMYALTLNYIFTAILIKEGFATYADSNMALMSVYYAALGAGVAAVALGDSGKAQEASKEMFRLLDRKSEIDGLDPDGITPDPGFQPGAIEFSGVVFAYPFRPKLEILKGMSFVVEAGQSVGLVGPAASGKSTVLALIQRFYNPQQGRVLVGAERTSLADINIRWWRSQIGFVGQEPVLFNTTLRQNVLYGTPDGAHTTQAQLDKCLELSNLGFIFESHGQGWETEVGPKGSRLSGGQRQRVAICRALIKDPPILLLDEAASALDALSEQLVSRALERARIGRTSFSIAHRLSAVEECDIILVAADGQIVEKGSDAELMMRCGVYAKLQQAQGKEGFCCA